MEDTARIDVLENKIKNLYEDNERLNRTILQRTREQVKINYTDEEVHHLKEDLAKYKALVNEKNEEIDRL